MTTTYLHSLVILIVKQSRDEKDKNTPNQFQKKSEVILGRYKLIIFHQETYQTQCKINSNQIVFEDFLNI